MTTRRVESIADVEWLMLNDPDEYDRVRRGWNNFAGAEGQADDLRVASIHPVAHLDTRRYGLGLSRLTAGMRSLRAGELLVVGAREGHGKTAYGELLALENAARYRVLFVTLEMTREEILDRMLAKLMRSPIKAVHAGRRDDSEDYCGCYTELVGRDLFIRRPEHPAERSIEAITKLAFDVSASLLVIDHAREITGWEPGKGASQIVDSLGRFVRKTGITAVLLSQLNRDAAVRRPHNGHFQDTGKLEQKADRTILLYRPFLGQGSRDRVCELIVSKNRRGPCFRAHAHWDGPSMSFHNMTDEEESLQTCCKPKRKEPQC